ncbi:terpenoid synthase [Macrolepiota fuliginosa MF-IS2]|uniref:(2E,6E)-farnesyl diphosphate synthase n=1 Tax=Macrolepiota fuliginosa MF-IS2 TaxID=1400762 RepID=A0A9P5XIN3_9AGAR|nr:terpenoid synthase [Macrolepiota fuliginosa MF-IS2]
MFRCALPVRRLSSLAEKRRPDPFTLLAPHLKTLRTDLLDLLGSGHPALTEITQYYFHHPSKQVRPLLVLLLSQATNGLGKNWNLKFWESTHPAAGGRQDELDIPLSPPDVLTDYNPQFPAHTSTFRDPFVVTSDRSRSHRKPYPHNARPPSLSLQNTQPAPPTLHAPTTILPTQLRLAQIVEMLHTASLLHDDVIDASALRRGAPSAPSLFTDKLSVLGGNFVLGRASAALARLGDQEVTQLIASVISNLVEGEILQMKDAVQQQQSESASDIVKVKADTDRRRSSKHQDAWNIYLQKTYLKTASLMAKGARSAVVLGGCAEGEIWKEAAYAYGRNLGIAFQLVDDVLDYESASATLGKPGNADLQLGLATAPALYAWEEYPEMGELIGRKFESTGDVEKARNLVHKSSAIQRTKQLALEYADEAKKVLQEFPESEARDALEVLAERVVGRKY